MKKYRIKEEYIVDYPQLKGVVFDEYDIDICQDVGSISMSVETALEFEEMSYKEQCEYIADGLDLDGQLISVNGTNEYDYTEFQGIYIFEEVKDDWL